MERTTKRRSVFGSIAIALVLACAAAAIGLFLLVSMAATASGTASLPNGATARINGPFSCSTKSQWTTIEAGGHTFTFSPTTVSIDGAAGRSAERDRHGCRNRRHRVVGHLAHQRAENRGSRLTTD